MKLKLWHAAVFLIALAVFAIARAPVSVFAPQTPGAFTYGRAEGTIWSARFTDARLGPYRVAEMDWRLSFWQLAQGRMVGLIELGGPGLRGQVRLLGNWGGDRRLIADSLLAEGAPLGEGRMLAGVTFVRGLDVILENGTCTSAKGVLESDVLSRNAESLGWTGPPLAGEAMCAGDAAELRLAGAAGGDVINAKLTLRPDGVGAWRAAVQSGKVEVQAGLAAAGFALDPGGQGLVRSGELRWVPF